MKRSISFLIVVMIVLSPFIQISAEHSFIKDLDAIEEAIKSILFIGIFDKDDELVATGSGFVAFTDRTIVTNYHVIEGAQSIYAMDEDDNLYEVERVLVKDEKTDIAILSIKSEKGLVPLKLANNPTIKRGLPVVAIGNPEGFVNTVSDGIISAVYDKSNTPDIQFTAPISHGSSGGPLFNDVGEVIGITSASYEEGQNINFAVGIYHVIDLYQQYNPNYPAETQIYENTQIPSLVPTTTAKQTVKPIPQPTPSPIDKPMLSAPDNLKANIYEQSVTLMWSALEGAEGYRVYRAYDDNGEYVLIGETTQIWYTDKTIQGDIVFYRVSALNDSRGWVSAQSDILMVPFLRQTIVPHITASPTQSYVPSPAQSLAPSQTPAPISFITAEEIARYKTLKPGMNDPDVARLKERMYDLGYFKSKTVNNNYTNNTAEYVKEFQRVNGLKVDGIASPEMQALFFSEYAITKPTPSPNPSPTPKPTPRLAKPTNLKASVSRATFGSDPIVTVTWKEVPGASGYRIYRLNALSEFDRLLNNYELVGIVVINQYEDTNVRRGFTYLYRVESFNGMNTSEISSYKEIFVPR